MSEHYLVKVPATSANMGPGFDCFGMALQLYNTFAFRTLEKDNELLFNADFSLRQNPRSNLVYRSYLHTLNKIGYKSVPGIEITAISDIPSARGLGSSASAVVAGVLAAGAITNTNLRLSDAIEIATEIEGHPDNVAPAILGKMTISLQEKNFIHTERIPFPEELAVMIAIPDIKVQTVQSRRVLPNRVTFSDAVFNLRRSALMIASLYNKDWQGLRHSMFDKLHQNQRANLIPGLMKIIHTARTRGAIGATLSGSGPSVMMMIERSNTEAIKRLSHILPQTWSKMNIRSEVKLLEIQEAVTKIKAISSEEFDQLTNKKPAKG